MAGMKGETTAKAVRCQLEVWSLWRILEKSNLGSGDLAEVINTCMGMGGVALGLLRGEKLLI